MSKSGCCEHGVPFLAGCPFCEDMKGQEVYALRAKLQAAEEKVLETQNLLVNEMVTSSDWKSRAETAEAEVESLSHGLNLALDKRERVVKKNGSLIQENRRLQAEVARLKGIESTLQAKVDNLAGLVRRLVHSLRKVGTNSSNIIRAMDYLKRNGLTGSILRSDEPQPAEIPESGGHIESADCWCGPTVEEHPGGTLIIHNQTH